MLKSVEPGLPLSTTHILTHTHTKSESIHGPPGPNSNPMRIFSPVSSAHFSTSLLLQWRENTRGNRADTFSFKKKSNCFNPLRDSVWISRSSIQYKWAGCWQLWWPFVWLFSCSDTFSVRRGHPYPLRWLSYFESVVVYDTFVCVMTDHIIDVSGHEGLCLCVLTVHLWCLHPVPKGLCA